MIRTTRTRPGATLVEVMIAAAMLMLGMWLLVWLYQQGMNSFIGTKAQIDLTAQERMVEAVMSTDLSRVHFLEEESKPNRGRRISDQMPNQAGYVPPRAGFFWARSTPATGTYLEPTDGDGFGSARSVDHYLQFTSLVPGGPDHLMFGAEVPARSGQQWYGTAAEITYALVPSSRTTPNGQPLYDLIRRQRLAARTTDDAPAYQPVITAYSSTDKIDEVMTVGAGKMLTLADLTVPGNGFGVPSYRLRAAEWSLAGGLRAGEERLVGNVLSMEVKFTGPRTVVGFGAWPTDRDSRLWPRPLLPEPVPPNPPSPFGGVGQSNSDYPYDYLPYNGEFDTYTQRLPYDGTQYATATASTHGRPLKPLRLTGVMIRLRLFHPQNLSTRQTTIIVSL